MSENSSNKTIAKNTIMLFIRMLISMLVGLYTSRVVLQTLGVEDYGIYGVVGGVVSMMGFLNASMSGATSRFITFELGRGDMQRVRDTFSSAMIIHIGIALVVILLAETVGLWFMCNKLVIPESRMEAAHWVYQCSIISAAVGVTQTPYGAVIMSREKMDIYAYMELLNVSLKLGIVYLLVIGDFDKLKFYAILTLAVSVFMAMLYRIYCVRRFEESRFIWVWKKELLKPMLSFSGWDLYGNMSFSAIQQGRTFIVNMFFGVAVNAACGIATTVQGVLQGFSTNITAAFRPQIIKAYASNDYCRFQSLIEKGIKFSTLFMMLVSVPLMINMRKILTIWLGEVPQYTTNFCVLLLLNNIIRVIISYLIIGIHASGAIKAFIYTGTISLLQIPVLYLLFLCTNSTPEWTYYIYVLFTMISVFLTGEILRRKVKTIRILYIYSNWILCIFIGVICALPLFCVSFFSSSLYVFFIQILVYGLEIAIIVYFCILNNVERVSFNKYIRKMIK